MHSMEKRVKDRREYHSPLRAEQADGTRRRVLAAARSLFLERGYAGTTVAAVAEASGVSPDTVYASLGGKRGLLKGVHGLALSDARDEAERDQEPVPGDGGQRDAAERLRRLVHRSCDALSRTSPIHAVLRGAADGHPFASELHREMTRSRLAIQSRNLRESLGPSFRDDLSTDEAAEHYSALLSPELYHLLTVEREWDPRRFEQWVGDILERDLLG
jgi:AcrR family transcriptional regulator